MVRYVDPSKMSDDVKKSLLLTYEYVAVPLVTVNAVGYASGGNAIVRPLMSYAVLKPTVMGDRVFWEIAP